MHYFTPLNLLKSFVHEIMLMLWCQAAKSDYLTIVYSLAYKPDITNKDFQRYLRHQMSSKS